MPTAPEAQLNAVTIATLLSRLQPPPPLSCRRRVHHRFHRLFLSQSAQPVHPQRPAERRRRGPGVAHRPQGEPGLQLPQRLRAGPHPASLARQPADLGGPPVHQEGDAAAQGFPDAQIRPV